MHLCICQLSMNIHVKVYYQEPGVVILQIENQSAPLRRRKIINLPQNCPMNFQKFPHFNKNGQTYAKI